MRFIAPRRIPSSMAGAGGSAGAGWTSYWRFLSFS